MPGVSKTITSTPTLLAAAKGGAARQWLRIELSKDATDPVFIGIDDAAVRVDTGLYLAPGRAMNIENTALAKPAAKAIYGICASGSIDVLVDEGT